MTSTSHTTPSPSFPTVLQVDPRTDPRWLELARGPGGSLFTSPPWISAICDGYELVPQARVAVDGDTVTGGFTWIAVNDIRGHRLSSLPFSDRAEPLLPDRATWDLVARDAFGSGVPLTVRCLEGSPVADDPRMAVASRAAWHGTVLDGTVEDLWRRFSPSLRRNIAAAGRNGVEVVARGDIDALRRYHQLHVALRKYKYRLLAQPVEFFERIWSEFAPHDAVLTLLARIDGQPVAGAVYLVWNDVLYYKFGASIADHLPLRPNDALHWAAIQWAADRGLRLLDWGLSDLDQPGLVAYKRKWGTTERRIITWRSGGEQTGPVGADTLLGELTGLLTADVVPDAVTARAGALLYRYFC